MWEDKDKDNVVYVQGFIPTLWDTFIEMRRKYIKVILKVNKNYLSQIVITFIFFFPKLFSLFLKFPTIDMLLLLWFWKPMKAIKIQKKVAPKTVSVDYWSTNQTLLTGSQNEVLTIFSCRFIFPPIRKPVFHQHSSLKWLFPHLSRRWMVKFLHFNRHLT